MWIYFIQCMDFFFDTNLNRHDCILERIKRGRKDGRVFWRAVRAELQSGVAWRACNSLAVG